MVDVDVIAYNVATFVSALFVLELGADKFVDHTSVVARRTGVPDTIIALLTAGAEWEELVVVVATLAQGRSSLAIGNIIGSAISNMLGAFSLGLLFRPRGEPTCFDRSSRTYSLFLLLVATFATPAVYFSDRITWLICGTTLIALFAAYVFSIGWAIHRGTLLAPQDSDSDTSDEDSEASSVATSATREAHATEEDALLHQHDGAVAAVPQRSSSRSMRRRRSLGYHIGHLIFGFLAICLAGYVLSHAAINVTNATGVSDVLFGIIILAIATTLPEKFVAVLSGHRGHIGILVANTAGSNIFLLSLCLGIIMLDTPGKLNHGNVSIPELALLWGTMFAFTLTVWFGGKFDRWIGGVMLFSYVVFIVLEFTVIHNVAGPS
ncbi:hypothetical protein VTI74DRAFT_10499 [Chaetomium olivicolor]